MLRTKRHHESCRRRARLPTLVTVGAKGAIAVLLTVLLCACSWLQANALSPIPAQRKHILLLSSAPLAVVGGQRYTGPGQQQAYLLLRGAAGQAELIYIDAVGRFGRAAIEYHGQRLRQFTADWVINSGGIKNWGSRHVLDTPMARFQYVSYSTTQAQRHCVAFQALWAIPPGDIRQRPGKVIFGYYCAPPGRPLDTTTLHQVLAGLRVGFHSKSSHVPQIALLPADSDSNVRGYRAFPRLLPIFHPASAGDFLPAP